MDAGGQGGLVTNAAWATAKERSRKGTAREGQGMRWLGGAGGRGGGWSGAVCLAGEGAACVAGSVCLLRRQPREKDGNAKLPTKMLQQPSAAKQTGRLKCRLPFPSDSQHPNKNTKPQMEVRHGTHASYLDNRQAWRAKGHPLRSEEVTLLWIKSECHHSNGAPPNDILSQDTHTPTQARSHQLPVALQGGGGRRRTAEGWHCALCEWAVLVPPC